MMQIFTSAVFSALLLGFAAAQDNMAPAPEYPLQSDAFFLKLQSSAPELDGQYLAAYHSGAAIEQLGLEGTEKPADTWLYHLNYSSSAPTVGDEPVGIITWNLPLGGSQPTFVSSGLTFAKNDTSDVIMMVFFPGPPQGEQTPLGFDEDDKLFAYITTGSNGETETVYEWFICSTYYGGYNYNALTWVPGMATHPTCHAVEVLREFPE